MKSGRGFVSAPRRVIKLIDDSIDKGLSILFLILLLIGIYFVYDSWWLYNASALDNLPGYAPESPEEMLEISKDAIAWITIDDTNISYPVMQGKDNSEYLNKNPQGDYSLSGSIFLDSNNNREFTDDYSVLYGHHMTNGFMFGAIDYFEKEEYFDKHRKGTLLVVNGKKYSVDIYAFMETDASVDTVFDVTVGGDIRGYVASNSKIYRQPAGGRVLALSTCKSPLTTERTVLFATIREEGEAGTKDDIQKLINKNKNKKKTERNTTVPAQ